MNRFEQYSLSSVRRHRYSYVLLKSTISKLFPDRRSQFPVIKKSFSDIKDINLNGFFLCIKSLLGFLDIRKYGIIYGKI